MQMWCERHDAYYDIQDWACPQCLVGDFIPDRFREKLIEEILSRLPDDDDKEFWDSREKIEEVIRASLERASSIQTVYNCMFYYDHERRLLDVSLIRSIESIKLSVSLA